MSGNKDTVHIPWAFSLTEAPRLPVTGEDHPLAHEFRKWLLWANGTALVLGLALFLSWYLVTHLKPKPVPVQRSVKIVRYTELGVPPSLAPARPSVPQVKIAQAVAPPSIGVPEPVPEVKAQAPTIATQTEMSEQLAPVDLSDLGGSGTGDSLVIDTGGVGEGPPSPDEFIPVDVQPVRLRMDPPVYPQMATQAGVEGTVLVQVLVGKDGKVKDTRVVDGPDMLKDAAVASARTALFKPAMAQNEPVEVWAIIPVTFKLN